MILTVEPTYADHEHAAVNVALLQAIGACGPVRLAATPEQSAAMQEAATHRTPTQIITVLPPGGVHLRRMAAQWRTLHTLVRQHRPEPLILLSAGPETMFVMRALVTRHPWLRIVAIMHGNLADITGWRSRDPRRRLIDLASGLRVARHPRIRLVVLEEGIRDAARPLIPHDLLVWPLTILPNEIAQPAPWAPGPRLNLVFPGTASRGKGFDTVRAWRAAAPDAYEWSIAGRPTPEYTATDMAGFQTPTGRLSRAAYLTAIRKADFALMALGPEYELTASGSLLDCVAQAKPLISLTSPALEALARRYGPPGHILPSPDAIQRLLADPARLRDPAAYAAFQQNLAAAAQDRLPQALAPIVCKDIQCSR